MLNITNHQGNANQNHDEISPHTCRNGYHQKDKKEQVLVRMWRKGNPCTLLWGCKLGRPRWKTVETFLKKLRIEQLYDPEIPLLGMENENTNLKRYTQPYVHYSIIHNSQDMATT